MQVNVLDVFAMIEPMNINYMEQRRMLLLLLL